MVGSSPYNFSLSECQPMWSLPSRYRFSKHELNSTPAMASNSDWQHKTVCQRKDAASQSTFAMTALKMAHLDLSNLWVPGFRLQFCVWVCIGQTSIACHISHLPRLHYFLPINCDFLMQPWNLLLVPNKLCYMWYRCQMRTLSWTPWDFCINFDCHRA